MKLKKITLGIRPSQKMFRISSLNGVLIDKILSLRGTAPIGDEYYSEIIQNIDQCKIHFRNEDKDNMLTIDRENIVFVKDSYDSKKQVDIDELFKEYRILWKSINETLHVNDIRRIGISVEFRFPIEKKNPSMHLMTNLMKIQVDGFPANFTLHFESRRFLSKVGAPDTSKDDFLNVIYDYYDSVCDVDHPESDHFNANLDVQRYYSPLLKSNIFDEVITVKKHFFDEKQKLKNNLDKFGLI